MRPLRPLALALVLASSLASSSERARPDDVGLSRERLERLSDFTQAGVKDGRFSGAVGLVARRGQVAYLEPIGMADIERGQPMREDSIFRIASMTKPIVSVAVMMLHEEGRFTLDDPISKFIPELEKPGVGVVTDGRLDVVPAAREITIHDLLTHTAGFTYPWHPGPLGDLYRSAKLLETSRASEELVRRLAEIPLVHQPGTTFVYGHSTDVLGRLIEIVSGKSLDLFLDERILVPLGMRDTQFYLTEAEADRLVTLYERGESRVLKPIDGGPESRLVVGSRTLFSGGGGLSSTAPDYYRFLQMLLNGGELENTRLLSRKSVELMTADHLGEEIPLHPGYGFGLGFAVRQSVGRGHSLGSGGDYTWGGIYNTIFWVDPKEELILIFLTNFTPYDRDQQWYVKALVYQAIER